MTESDPRTREVAIVLACLSAYRRAPLADDGPTRALTFAEIGLSSLTLASVIVELEDRLDRPFDFEAFAGVETVGDLLRAVGLS